MTDLLYDPASYALQEDPFPTYRRMTEESPLHHNPKLGFWALTRFDDVIEGLSDHVSLSSAQGTLIEQIAGEPPPDMMIFTDPPRQRSPTEWTGYVIPSGYRSRDAVDTASWNRYRAVAAATTAVSVASACASIEAASHGGGRSRLAPHRDRCRARDRS